MLIWIASSSAALAAPPEVILAGNLNGTATEGTAIEVNVEVSDLVGGSYVLLLRFLNFGPGAWVWDASTTDPRVLNPNPLGSGIAFFDDDGAIVSSSGPDGWINVQLQNGTSFQGTNAVTVQLDSLSDRVGATTVHQVGMAPPTGTRTPSPTRIATRTQTSTRTPTLSRTPSPTRTPSSTRTVTNTRTTTKTRTPSSTATPSRTGTITRTPSVTRTRSVTRTPSVTRTVTLTRTPTLSRTARLTSTIATSRTETSTRTPTSTRTATSTRTSTPQATSTRTRTATRTRTPHPVLEALILTGNLNSDTDETTVVEHGAGFVDSLGQPHNLTLRFEKRAFSNAWQWEISTFDAAILDPSPLASGMIGFGDNGLASIVPGEPEGLLQLNFANGAHPTTGTNAIRVELDGLTGHAAGTSVQTNSPPRPTPVPTRTPRVSTPTRTATTIRTHTPTRTATRPISPTVTPIGARGTGSTVEWHNSPLNLDLVTGNTTVETMTIKVARPLVGARAVVSVRGGTVEIDPIPTELEAGVDYPITLRMTVSRAGQRLVGSIRIMDRSKASLGPTGKFVVAIKEPPPTPTRTVMPGVSPTVVGGTPRPRSTVVLAPRITWRPARVHEFLEPGETASIQVVVESTSLIVQPSFHFFGRSGVAQVDPSTLPARLEPGEPHTLQLLLTLPADRIGRSENLTLAVRSNGQTFEGQLIVDLTPRG